jgi:ABC-2 type transport system permease protein
MNPVLTLLRPRLLAARRAAFSRQDPTASWRFLLFGLLGLAFWLGIFALFYRVLTYFQSIGEEGFGDILAIKLLSMVFPTFFALLLFSGVVTSLSKLYLSRDLHLVHALPVSPKSIFTARWIESTMDSSWMVAVYALPVFFSYGMVYSLGPVFYLNILAALLPFCVIASALSAIAIMLVVLILPANRFRSILIFLGIGVFLVAYIALRLVRPERLVDPDASLSLVRYMASLQTPSSPFLPSTWAFDSMREALAGNFRNMLFHNALALSAAGSLAYLAGWISQKAYYRGVSKSQTAKTRTPGPLNLTLWRTRPFAFWKGPSRALFVREVKTFFRDSTQWSQVFLMAALIAIYLYNFKVLPIEQAPIRAEYLQNTLAFLNMGLAAFVMTALAARFVYPAVSLEKDAFWILKASPVSIRTVLLVKFFIYLPPLLLLSEFLIIATNRLLSVTPFMMALSVSTIFMVVPGIIAMGIGLGAAYPDFQSENPAQSVTSFGGLLFMILSAAFIGAVIVIQAGPVYRVVRAGLTPHNLSSLEIWWLVMSLAAVAALCVAAVILPLRFGIRSLTRMS